MASATLYPPIVDTYTSAFIASGNSAYCRVYYSLSKFSTNASNIKSVHFSITKQSSGENVLNKIDNVNNNRFRATGTLIINTAPTPVSGQENLYYTDILNEDIKNGWTVGWIYKIQVRFSTEFYDQELGQAAWLTVKNNYFSEWSTYTITKGIAKPIIKIPTLNGYNSEVDDVDVNTSRIYTLATSTLEFTGSYSNEDKSEVLYNYQIQLYDNRDNLIEQSKVIYSNQYTPNQFYYLFNTELENNTKYVIKLEYETLNKFKEVKTFNIDINQLLANITNIKILTAEDGGIMQTLTSIEEEQDDGRIGLKLYSENTDALFTNICIRRSDSKTNFQSWTDIKIFNLRKQSVNSLPVFYDYTIESGVWYKYGVQIVSTDNFRTDLKEHRPVKREFYYSYLLGEGGRQLRLTFNENVSSFKNTYSESKLDTIGGKYPFITRNGNMKYKSFPINAMISFNMDTKNLFTNKLDIYEYQDVVDLYNQENLGMYDYTYERDFRNEVLEFLEDGKPKLFKSPTEGNILVRLMDINTTPEQALDRLISSFSCNAYEIEAPTMENYFKYKFYTVGQIEKDLFITGTRLGQINAKVPVKDIQTNLFDLIVDKYSNDLSAGKEETVTSIYALSIVFNNEPLLVYNNAGMPVYGFNIELNGKKITINSAYTNVYQFDNEVIFTPEDSLIFFGSDDEKNPVDTIDITANFLYDVTIRPIKEKQILYKKTVKNIGQIYKSFNANDSIYREIYYRHKYDWNEYFRVLSQMDCVNIEANPGTTIQLKDVEDHDIGDKHIINETGVLDLTGIGAVRDLIYLGITDPVTGELIDTEPSDILVDYMYYLTEGKYATKEE